MTYSHAYYVGQVLEEDVSAAYNRFNDAGVLNYELTAIVEVCKPLVIGLDANDQSLRGEISFLISRYLLDYSS
jgi:hypothetical protein